MHIEELNKLAESELKEKLQKCCGSSYWVEKMLHSKPFLSLDDMLFKADQAWKNTGEKDWLEAFSRHPKIGDLKSLEKKFASTKSFAKNEQSAVDAAPQAILEKLAEGNSLYENKFGFIFIVCATGKSADEMLELLQARLHHARVTELITASAEQHKITKLRLQKILS